MVIKVISDIEHQQSASLEACGCKLALQTSASLRQQELVLGKQQAILQLRRA